MRQTLTRLLFINFIIIAPMSSAFAQGIQCANDEVIQDCFNKFVPSLPEPKTPAAIEATKVDQEKMALKKVSAANTGLSNLVSPSSSSVLDFLSLLSASLQSTTFDRNAQTFTLDFNIPVGMMGRDDQVKFQTVLAKPKIGSEVEKLLGTNAAAIKTLNDAFNIGDDITASATYNPVNRYYGRSIAPHRALFQAMLIAAVQPDARHEALVHFRKAVRDLNIDQSKTFDDAATTANLKADEVKARLFEGFEAERSMYQAFTKYATRFASLLNNQPQRYVSLLYHDRQNTVGPNEWSGKLSWEFGHSNLNDFYNNEGKDCVAISADDKEGRGVGCLQEFETYVTRTKVDSTAASNRYAVSAEYHSTSSVNVDLPLYTLTFNAKGGHSLVYKATWGRSLDPTLGDHEARIDGAVNYEDNSKESTKRDRWVGSLTYTVKFSEKMSIPVSLVYANHQQYLSDVNKKLSAHFGLIYKLPSK
jgi:hypothetical protein